MHIKDNLHGMLYFDEQETRIIDHPQFQRLRKIKQLAMAYLVYPGATHTRYAHSLGTAYLAEKMAEALVLRGIDVDVKLAKIKGLLHDVGHSAFSHTGEDILKKYVGSHEQIGKQKIKEISEVIDNYSYNELISNNKEEAIIAGELGADRMDYLLRDSLHTGVAYGIVDWQRILSKLIDIDTIEYNTLETVESLLIARFLMFSTVYQHKVVRIASEMLKETIRRAISDGMDYKILLERGDDEALMVMEDYPSSRELSISLQQRRLWRIKEEIEVDSISEEKIEQLKKDNRLISIPNLKQKRYKVYVGKERIEVYKLSALIRSLVRENKRKKIFILEE